MTPKKYDLSDACCKRIATVLAAEGHRTYAALVRALRAEDAYMPTRRVADWMRWALHADEVHIKNIALGVAMDMAVPMSSLLNHVRAHFEAEQSLLNEFDNCMGEDLRNWRGE